MERLQKILSSRGVASRRQAEEWIRQGRVRVDGAVAQLGQQADPERARIEVDGRVLPAPEKRVVLLLNKPRGYVTTLSDERGRRTVAELVADCGVRVYPVGRLDMDSEGLLLLTNDGALANSLMHPSHQVDKVYRVWVSSWQEGATERLARPIVLDGRAIAPPGVELLERQGDRAVYRVTIHEGRNRQVRRMCQAAGLDVQRLLRVEEGPLKLGELRPGTWRRLSKAEIASLKK